MNTIFDFTQIDLGPDAIARFDAQLQSAIDAAFSDECTACDNTGLLLGVGGLTKEPCSECRRGK